MTVKDKDAEFKLTSGAGGSSAVFEGVMPEFGDTFDVQYPVTDPDISTQNYSSTEAIPHDKMKFTATGCSFASPSFTLTASNAALRLNLYGTDQTISKIVVKDASSNAYTLDISPAVKLPAEKKDSMAFFIVVPAGKYKFSAEIFDNSLTPASICKFEPSAAQTFSAANVLNMPAKEVKASPSIPEGALSGVFSVGENTKVHFSKGNLRAIKKGESWTWGFYDYQYEINSLNSGSSRSAASTDTEIDLFTWGYGDWSTKPNKGSYQEGEFTDWGAAIDDKGTWRTLRGGEWTYLLSTRTVNGGNGEGKSYQLATINSDDTGVYGLIIYPDNYTSQTTETSYTSAQWTAMESAGCVFLPAAGYRYDYDVSTVGILGSLWSSTVAEKSGAYRLSFDSYSSQVTTEDNIAYRGIGYSVRLVSAAQ